MEYIDPKDTALEIAVKMQADKLIYLSRYPGIYTDETRSDVYPVSYTHLDVYKRQV